MKNYHFLKEGKDNGTLQGSESLDRRVTEIRLPELVSVINAEEGEGLEFVENMIYLCSSGK